MCFNYDFLLRRALKKLSVEIREAGTAFEGRWRVEARKIYGVLIKRKELMAFF